MPHATCRTLGTDSSAPRAPVPTRRPQSSAGAASPTSASTGSGTVPDPPRPGPGREPAQVRLPAQPALQAIGGRIWQWCLVGLALRSSHRVPSSWLSRPDARCAITRGPRVPPRRQSPSRTQTPVCRGDAVTGMEHSGHAWPAWVRRSILPDARVSSSAGAGPGPACFSPLPAA
jgi:hypothetical protein